MTWHLVYRFRCSCQCIFIFMIFQVLHLQVRVNIILICCFTSFWHHILLSVFRKRLDPLFFLFFPLLSVFTNFYIFFKFLRSMPPFSSVYNVFLFFPCPFAFFSPFPLFVWLDSGNNMFYGKLLLRVSV